MLNRYPLWKYLLLLAVLVVGIIFALPNIYGDDPAVQVSGTHGTRVDSATLKKVDGLLKAKGIPYKSSRLEPPGLLVRFHSTDTQLKAYDIIRNGLSNNYTVAVNLAPATPAWLRDIGAQPMYLGLDLRGGVHFLLEIDMNAALTHAVNRYVDDFRSLLRQHNIRYLMVNAIKGKASEPQSYRVEVKFRNAQDRSKAESFIHSEYRELVLTDVNRDGTPFLVANLSQEQVAKNEDTAVQQNITTLRNRVNELGVAEPIIQRQGKSHIVVELPGVQDTARAKDILGATATLEYHLVDEKHDVQAALNGDVPPGSRIYYDKNGRPILLKRQVIVTGNQIINAAAGIDQQSGGPEVSVTLDGAGARRMSDITRDNIGKRMAVVYIETKTQTRMVDGKPVRKTQRIEKVISVAVIRDHFGKRFQTTGLDSSQEAHTLALLLRAGALAAPMDIVEERTIGPSLGKENIAQGFQSVVIGFVLVLVAMGIYYRAFGMVANLALFFNLVLIVAILSMLQATLTMPGIAGIVLTVGMAVDANVLIYERIREELRAGNSIQSSIHAGYERAFGTIADSNITTLIAGLVLFIFGTGPVKGFAVTLSVGIATSMFTAIMGTRAVVNLVWGRRRLQKLSI